MTKKILPKLFHANHFRHFVLATIEIIAVVSVGVYIYNISYAATPYASVNTASGTLSGVASVQSSLSQNGEKYVQFGSVSPSTNQVISSQGFTQGQPALMIPAYVYPAYFNGSSNVLVGTWATLAKTKPANPNDIVIANVDTGPCNYSGTTCSIDPNYTMAIKAIIAEGWKVYGYVDTGYLGTTVPGNSTTPRLTRSGSTSESAWINQIQMDETQWYKAFGKNISGLFLDDVSNSSSYLSVYQSLATYDSTYYGNNVIFNPGDAPSSTFTVPGAFHSGNAMQFYESCYSSSGSGCSGGMTWKPGSTPADYSPLSPSFYRGIAAVFTVYSTPQADLNSVISSAKSLGAAYLYVSDQNFGAISYFPNGNEYCSGSPYCNLPTYFNSENTDLAY